MLQNVRLSISGLYNIRNNNVNCDVQVRTYLHKVKYKNNKDKKMLILKLVQNLRNIGLCLPTFHTNYYFII